MSRRRSGELLGVIVQFGGQTPLKLAAALEKAGIPILGTSPDAIDLAEDRERFAALVDKLGLRQPQNGIARSRDEAIAVAERIGYPVLMRPTYVLGGRAMEIVDGPAQLDDYIHHRGPGLGRQPGADRPVSARRDRGRRRRDLRRHRRRHRRRDAAYRGSRRPFGRQRLLAAALQPRAPRSSPRSSGRPSALAEALGVVGLMNVQFAVKDGEVYLIEVNPRASRTVPFVAKAIGAPVAKIAARVMAGEKLADLPPLDARDRLYRGQGGGVPVRALPGDRSGAVTGNEVHRRSHGNRSDFADGLPQVAAGGGARSADRGHPVRLGQGQRQAADPRAGRGAARHGLHGRSRPAAPPIICEAQGLRVERVNKVAQGRPHIVDRIKDGEIAIVFNTTEGWQSHKDSASIRASALMQQGALFHHRRLGAPRWRGRSRCCRTAALKCARCRTIIPLPEHDPAQSEPRSGGALTKRRSERSF